MPVRVAAHRAALTALEVVDDALPVEFSIFAPGDNPSTTGPAIWDAVSAAAVMARVKERGKVDYMIDLEHRSLDRSATSLTKDAADAMGWFNIELRGLELWAVNVRWTPEGAERLRSKKQRYTSPAFYWLNDEPNGRVGEIINVGLVSMPATHDQQALVAASRLAVRGAPASASDVARALDAALKDAYPPVPNGCGSAWVCDVYPEFFVYEHDGAFYQAPFTYAAGVATIAGAPVKVTRQYVPVVPVNDATRARAKQVLMAVELRARAARSKAGKR